MASSGWRTGTQLIILQGAARPLTTKNYLFLKVKRAEIENPTT